MHRAHFALDKLYYSSSGPSRIRIHLSKGRLSGGCVRVGDGGSADLSHCLSEIKDRDDMIVTNYCPLCRCITMF